MANGAAFLKYWGGHMPHFTSPKFWAAYRALPPDIRMAARRCYRLLKKDPRHPSLHLKQIGRLWSARVGIAHRALGVEAENGILWFWIGNHAEYNRHLRR